MIFTVKIGKSLTGSEDGKMDYEGLYEDLLSMERRAKEHGYLSLAERCRKFRVDLLLAGYICLGMVRVS